MISKLKNLQSIPVSNRAYVGAFSDRSVTISGPPSTLSLLSGAFPISNPNRKEIDVYGPYHASHLHTLADIELILGSNPHTIQILNQYSSRFSVSSTNIGTWFDKNTSASKLLVSVLSDILLHPLKRQVVLSTCAQGVTDLMCLKCRIVSCGSNDFQNVLSAFLKSATKAEISLHGDYSEVSSVAQVNQNPTFAKRSKLAIVGMAGRFPNAADHEKFWSLLEAGLDVHKKVNMIDHNKVLR